LYIVLSTVAATSLLCCRFKNTRFDVIGGAIYFLSVVSLLPRCDLGTSILEASTLQEALWGFIGVYQRCWATIVMDSYLSLATVLCLFFVTLGFAKGGGVGAVVGEQPRGPETPGGKGAGVGVAGGRSSSSGGNVLGFGLGKRGRGSVLGPLVTLRTGGFTTQLLVALVHCSVHLMVAITLLLLLELGVETCIR
jgi:hypothetical protein